MKEEKDFNEEKIGSDSELKYYILLSVLIGAILIWALFFQH